MKRSQMENLTRNPIFFPIPWVQGKRAEEPHSVNKPFRFLTDTRQNARLGYIDGRHGKP